MKAIFPKSCPWKLRPGINASKNSLRTFNSEFLLFLNRFKGRNDAAGTRFRPSVQVRVHHSPEFEKKKKKFHSPQIGSQSSEVYEYVHLFP